MVYRVIVAVVLALSLAATGAKADQPAGAKPVAPVPGGDDLSLSEYYGDAVSHIGSFPGKLVCISSDDPYVPEVGLTCGPDKIYALSIQKPEAVVPLVKGSEPSSAELEGFVDKDVVVRGKHYPDKGTIAVSSIESARTAADAPAP